jgi:hypothetical protein
MACMNVCLNKQDRPLVLLSNWFVKEANDFEYLTCLINTALHYRI